MNHHENHLNLVEILDNLGNQNNRPIFHSECDFQHALAWKIHEQHLDYQIRLEYPYELENPHILNQHCDIFVKDNDIKYFIELKYKTKKLDVTINEEHYSLKISVAERDNRFHFLRDIGRLEEICTHHPNLQGFAIFLTNDYLYWQEDRANMLINHGHLNINFYNGNLGGHYEDLGWGEEDYSNFDEENGRFRYLIVEI